MRDYLYIWHDPEQQFIVASGIESKDLLMSLAAQTGIVLIKHQSETTDYDFKSKFCFSPSSSLTELIAENIYSWGDFVWADYATSEFPVISEEDVAELLFFGHMVKPLNKILIPSLRNEFLVFCHDDGWYLKLYYLNWESLKQVITKAIPNIFDTLSVSELKQGIHGFWIKDGKVYNEEKINNVDYILNRRL